MKSMLTLVRREFAAYFQSPIAYVVFTVFLVCMGGLFQTTVDRLTPRGPSGVEFPMLVYFENEYFWLIFILIPPLLTMRLFAEERGSGTLEMLMTAPIRDWQIVAGKFIACSAFYKFLWLPTLIFWPIFMDLHPTWNLQAGITVYSIMMAVGIGLLLLGLVIMPWNRFWTGYLIVVVGTILAAGFGYLHYTKNVVHIVDLQAGIDPYPIFTSYVGIMCAGIFFLSIGIFISSLVKSQMVAALLSVVTGILLVGVGKVLLPQFDPSGLPHRILGFFTVSEHFTSDFGRGLIDTRNIVFYLSGTFMMLFLTVRSVESRRWR
ncbi:MAG: ABC transporter permease [Zavarzinella sp.]